MCNRRVLPFLGLHLALAAGLLTVSVDGADWTMRGRDRTRNPVSPEKNAPTDWQIGNKRIKQKPRNIRWSARLGMYSCGDPVVANGLVWVGTNNENPRDSNIKVDASVLMCFRERDGKFLYQYVSPPLLTTTKFGPGTKWSS